MKRTLFTLLLLSSLACKKKSQYCYYSGMDGNRMVYVWEYNRPTSSQIKQVEDTCACTLSIKETCLPCKPQTDSNGVEIACE